MHNLPPPAIYALMDFDARGCVIAALNLHEVSSYAEQYAAYLTSLMDGSNVAVSKEEVIDQMMVCAIGWRGAHRGEAS